MPHRRVRQPQNAPRIHHLRITRRAARNARDGSAAPGHAAPACNADSGRRLAASPLRRSQARRACTGGGGVSREQAHRSRIRFATPAAPRCHRLSIIASDLGLRDGPARTACLRCKRSNGRSKKRRVRPVTCEFATDCRAGGRPRIRAKQESRLAAAVRIYSFELGSGATGIRTPDFLHAMRTPRFAHCGQRWPCQQLRLLDVAPHRPPSPLACSPYCSPPTEPSTSSYTHLSTAARAWPPGTSPPSRRACAVPDR
jgi:hypothetical protein